LFEVPFNEKVVSRAVLELDDELPVSVCCHWTFLIRADLNRPTVAYLHLPVTCVIWEERLRELLHLQRLRTGQGELRWAR
jgi:hypothetical protein